VKLELAGKTGKVPIDSIRPYWRNPRRIPQEAVDKVAKSLRDYGWQQPIVTDSEGVIVVGHTRYAAARHLGWTHVQVAVSHLSEERNREYRLVDNRTAELSNWDYPTLATELREFDSGLLDGYFPEVDLQIGDAASSHDVTSGELDTAREKVKRVTEADPAAVHTTEVVCPACFHAFSVRTRSLPGLTQEDLDLLAYGESA
jgi:hypothetical protein